MQQKASSFWGGGFAPRPPDQLGALPLDPAGGTAPDPQHLPPMLAIPHKPRVSG